MSRKNFASGLMLTLMLVVVSGCDLPFMQKFMARVHKESQDDTRFAKESTEFNALIRNNRFRQALAWTQKWEKVRDLSNANRKKVLKDERTVRMLGAA